MMDRQAARGLAALPTSVARRLAGAVRPAGIQRLPRLADVHPGHPTGGRWIGLQTVPVECVRGTASTATSRAVDFRPLDDRAPADWEFRWSRLASAVGDQTILPPVQLLRVEGDYWVVDGHNRIALARDRGQVWIDADVTELELSARSNIGAASGKEHWSCSTQS
jgi:hypothetical protein